MNWFHLSRNLLTLSSVICYLQSTQIKCISHREHLLLSSIGASMGKQQDLIDLKNQELRSCRFKKVGSPSRKLSFVLEEEPTVKPKRAKKPAKKSTTVPIAGVVIRKTPSESMPKKKTLAKVDRGKGMDLLSDVIELLPNQRFLMRKKTRQLGDSGDDDGSDDDSDDDDSDADGGNEASDSEKIDSDEDDYPNLNQNDDEEAKYEKEYVCTPDIFEFTEDDEEYEELYKDVNVRLKDIEHKEERKGDEEMTDVGCDDGTQQTTYEQVKDDKHVILTTVQDTQKTEVPLQSLSISFEFTNQFLKLDNVPTIDIEVVSMMNVKSTLTPTLAPTTATTITSIRALPYFSSQFRFDQRVSALEKELSQLKQADYSASYTTEFEKKAKDERKRYIDLVEKSVKDVIKDEVKSQLPQILPKEVSDYATPMIQSSIIESLKNIRDLEDKDKDKDPPAGSDQGLKKQKTSKDSAQAEEPMFEVADTKMPLNQGDDVGNTDDQTNVKMNPEGHKYPFDLSKPLPLIEDQGCQVVPANYFINNDFEYMKGRSSSRKYTTSTTKTKAAKYDTIEGIEDMVLLLWSLVKVAYDKYAIWGITHWGPKRQRFYGYLSNRQFMHDVFFTKRIITVTHIKVIKWYHYGYLEEIVIKLSNLERDLIYDLNVALRMFTRRVVILKWVEDLQLRVKSCQKKLNITKPETFRVLHDIASSLRMDYLPKRRWSKLDRKRSRIMIKVIDQQLFERRLIRNLEKFVCGRDYENNLRLLEWAIWLCHILSYFISGNPDGCSYWIETSQDS
nr:hypothetical protein [Tanacetum cinerariifolium]